VRAISQQRFIDILFKR